MGIALVGRASRAGIMVYEKNGPNGSARKWSMSAVDAELLLAGSVVVHPGRLNVIMSKIRY